MYNEQEFKKLQEEVKKLSKELEVNIARTQLIFNSINSPRVSFDNFEGRFKILTSDPTSGTSTFTPDSGTLYFYDDGATRRIYVRINNSWRYINLT